MKKTKGGDSPDLQPIRFTQKCRLSLATGKIYFREEPILKKALVIALALMLIVSLAACGGGDSDKNNGSDGSNNSGNQELITENRITGDGSMAREQYYADTVRDEFTFDKDGILTGYKTIYTFEPGVTDEQKQEGLDTLLGGNFTASIDGNTIVVDGNGNYLGLSYAESNLTEIKERLDGKDQKYNLGELGKVEAPTSSNNGGTSTDINTVEGRLSKAGLKLEDIKTDTFAEASLYNCDKDEVTMYLTNDNNMLGEAVMQALVEKIMAATAAAGDGKNYKSYYGMGVPEEIDMSDVNYDVWYFIGQWSYKVGDKWVSATLGVLPAEEPDGQDNYNWAVTLAFLY